MEPVGGGEDGERRGQITRGPWSPERSGDCSPLTGRPPSPAPASLKRGRGGGGEQELMKLLQEPPGGCMENCPTEARKAARRTYLGSRRI